MQKNSLLPQFSTKKWTGLATDLPSFTCEHGSLCEKHVAFQSVDSGRRFLACAHKVCKNPDNSAILIPFHHLTVTVAFI